MYLVGSGPWMVVASRFVSGAGVGVQASLFGFTARNCADDGLSRKVTKLSLSKYVGLAVGPAIMQAFETVEFRVGGLRVNKLSFVGVG